MITFGTQVYVNYGAMHPITNGEVVGIEDRESGETYAHIMCDDGAVKIVDIEEIQEESDFGSPIGWFIAK